VIDADEWGGSYAVDSDGRFSPFVRRETHDNRVVLFFDSLGKGVTSVHYRLYAQTPGQYRILPTSGYLTYAPEVRGSSGFATERIAD
jgi:uncharacterized protein YfaS (alpha-2-macroglobulin family)